MTTAPSRSLGGELLLPAFLSGDDTETLVLPADFDTEKAAWAFVDAALERWRQTALAPRVHTAAGELVANALEHGMADAPAESFEQPLALAVLREGPVVLCAVFDPGPALPDPLAGYGLRVVEAASDTWGWTTPGPSGKGVWASVTQNGTGGAPGPGTIRRLLQLAEILTGAERPRLVVVGEEPPAA
ncbi:ATP-binding protein [Streptomyces sp. KLOTTS4A1]|uniref:ATP-binding protein n=1 Tax=Streptomyces sp. KLOTTS4A1 TaxID=3390996 RepID=UPI0039F4E89A